MFSGIFERWAERRLGPARALPFILGRRQVYILPTGAGWMLLSMSGTAMLAALNYTSNEALLTALLLGGCMIGALMGGHRALEGLTIVSIVPEPGHEGDGIVLDIEIKTRPKARGLIALCGEAQATFLVDAQGRGVASLMLPATARGVWQVPRVCIATRQPLGLGTAWTWILAKETPVRVWPALEAAPAPLPRVNEGERQAMQSPLQNQDVRSLRPYRPGDPVRQIAWKQTARTGRTVVREYDRPSGQAIIDWDQLSHLPIEQRLRRIATWVVEAERCGRPTHLRLPQQQIGPGKGGAHKRACLDALAEMPHG